MATCKLRVQTKHTKKTKKKKKADENNATKNKRLTGTASGKPLFNINRALRMAVELPLMISKF